jgi:hypothetical protein
MLPVNVSRIKEGKKYEVLYHYISG